ncbi:hypothetical protein MHL39_10660 [Roseomonas mucosa]|jgi:hypothetical protein|uniref:hypothetical protein n=1 Tax=Roseomonas mucosa TaxID=207340 RepID=UPI001EF40E31|nr:hypothetical protein [Roseomonas mucosa]MCG7357099.1 hypothetical protein [Roseomonas mucosa]
MANLSGTISATGPTPTVIMDGDDLVQIAGTFTGSIQPEMSLNGTDFSAVGDPITAPGIYAAPEIAFKRKAKFRLNCTALSAGTPKYIVG